MIEVPTPLFIALLLALGFGALVTAWIADHLPDDDDIRQEDEIMVPREALKGGRHE